MLVVKKDYEIKKQLKMITRLIFFGMAMMFFFLVSMLVPVLQGEIIDITFWPQMIPFELSFRVDGLSISMALISLILWSAVFIYSIRYIKKNILRYYVLLLLVLGAVQDTFFAIDLVNFYIFLEMTTIFAYFLIIHNKDVIAQKAGFKYLIMSIAGAFLILLSILLSYQYTGNYKLTGILSCGYPLVPILFLIGCFIKAGTVPLHTWLPDAHPAAPTPISAFLSGIMIKIGAYGIIRVLFPINNTSVAMDSNIINLLNSIIIIAGFLSILTGGFLALIQEDAKRLLAYSSISQMGYILCGIGIGSQIGLTGGFLHIINHTAFKGLLFLSLGAAIFRVSSNKFADLGGLWKKMPLTALTCIIAALSISGIPPFGGFASKMLIGKAVGEYSIILKYLFTLSSALTFAYILKLIVFTFFGKDKKSLKIIEEAPLCMLMPLFILSFLCIIFGLYAGTMLDKLIPIAINEIFGYQERFDIVLWTEKGIITDTILTIIIGLLFYFVSLKIGLINKEYTETNKSIILNKSTAILSIDLLYCYFAKIVLGSSQKISKVHSRDINMHLSWIPLTFVIVYLILYFSFR
jgi:multicomponent Na+:H+ antiporter subunit D